MGKEGKMGQTEGRREEGMKVWGMTEGGRLMEGEREVGGKK